MSAENVGISSSAAASVVNRCRGRTTFFDRNRSDGTRLTEAPDQASISSNLSLTQDRQPSTWSELPFSDATRGSRLRWSRCPLWKLRFSRCALEMSEMASEHLESSEARGADQNPSEVVARHKCFLCSRTYERQDHLSRHLKSHENERSHRCPDCGKGFNRA